jgi:hypothetical protein
MWCAGYSKQMEFLCCIEFRDADRVSVLFVLPYTFFKVLLAMTPKSSKIRFPLWQYLTQPLFEEQCPAILNPRLYWHLYQVRYLEKCWTTYHRPEEHFHN